MAVSLATVVTLQLVGQSPVSAGPSTPTRTPDHSETLAVPGAEHLGPLGTTKYQKSYTCPDGKVIEDYQATGSGDQLATDPNMKSFQFFGSTPPPDDLSYYATMNDLVQVNGEKRDTAEPEPFDIWELTDINVADGRTNEVNNDGSLTTKDRTTVIYVALSKGDTTIVVKWVNMGLGDGTGTLKVWCKDDDRRRRDQDQVQIFDSPDKLKLQTPKETGSATVPSLSSLPALPVNWDELPAPSGPVIVDATSDTIETTQALSDWTKAWGAGAVTAGNLTVSSWDGGVAPAYSVLQLGLKSPAGHQKFMLSTQTRVPIDSVPPRIAPDGTKYVPGIHHPDGTTTITSTTYVGLPIGSSTGTFNGVPATADFSKTQLVTPRDSRGYSHPAFVVWYHAADGSWFARLFGLPAFFWQVGPSAQAMTGLDAAGEPLNVASVLADNLGDGKLGSPDQVQFRTGNFTGGDNGETGATAGPAADGLAAVTTVPSGTPGVAPTVVVRTWPDFSTAGLSNEPAVALQAPLQSTDPSDPKVNVSVSPAAGQTGPGGYPVDNVTAATGGKVNVIPQPNDPAHGFTVSTPNQALVLADTSAGATVLSLAPAPHGGVALPPGAGLGVNGPDLGVAIRLNQGGFDIVRRHSNGTPDTHEIFNPRAATSPSPGDITSCFIDDKWHWVYSEVTQTQIRVWISGAKDGNDGAGRTFDLNLASPGVPTTGAKVVCGDPQGTGSDTFGVVYDGKPGIRFQLFKPLVVSAGPTYSLPNTNGVQDVYVDSAYGTYSTDTWLLGHWSGTSCTPLTTDKPCDRQAVFRPTATAARALEANDLYSHTPFKGYLLTLPLTLPTAPVQGFELDLDGAGPGTSQFAVANQQGVIRIYTGPSTANYPSAHLTAPSTYLEYNWRPNPSTGTGTEANRKYLGIDARP
ncbi:MAG: hypothetical protein QOE97_2992 [Pseudonocardiales bacterium]|nr:hypothetical protein [Pseudonocardiales bacterium]